MNEMTLPSRHMIRNSNPGGLRPSSLPLGHGGSPHYWIFTNEQGRNILFLWNLNARGSDPRSPTPQAGSSNHCTRAPAPKDLKVDVISELWLFLLLIYSLVRSFTYHLSLHIFFHGSMFRFVCVNLFGPTLDVRIWRLKSIPALKE